MTSSHLAICNNSCANLCQDADHVTILDLYKLARQPFSLFSPRNFLLESSEEIGILSSALIIRQLVDEFEQLVSIVGSHGSENNILTLQASSFVDPLCSQSPDAPWGF